MANARDRAVAIQAIVVALSTMSEVDLRIMLCAAVGHPPIARVRFGEIICARCGGITGDLVTRGAPHTNSLAFINHDCAMCRAIVAKLTPNDLLLLPRAAMAFLAALTPPAKKARVS